MGPTLIIGAIIGAHILHALPHDIIKYAVIMICTAGFFYAVRKINHSTTDIFYKGDGFIPHWKIVACIAGLVLGMYDGVSGAGGGVIMTIVLVMIFGLDIKTIFSLMNVLSTLSLGTAAITFIYLGLIYIPLLCLMIPGAILAGALGAKVAIILPEKALRVIYAALIFVLVTYLVFA